MPIIKKDERQVLKPGMIIDAVVNNPNAAIYRVENITADDPPVLTLCLIDEKGEPLQEPYIINQESVIFGRAKQAELQTTNMISGKHFKIQREDSQFVYTHLGLNAALLSDDFQMREVENIRALAKRMSQQKNVIKRTRYLEKPSDLANLNDQIKGGRSEDDLDSYILLIRAYSYLKLKDMLDQKNILQKVNKIWSTLEDERIALRAIQENPANKAFFADSSIECPFQKELDSLVEKKLSQLKKVGQVFVESGLPHHQAFSAVSALNDGITCQYYHLTFDAGLGTRLLGQDRAAVVYGQDFQQSSETEIKRFFYLNYLRKLCGGGFDDQFQSLLKGDFKIHLEDTPQRRGNCTTRAPRNLLKYILLQKLGVDIGGQLFADIYKFVHMHKEYPLEKIIQDLESLAAKIEQSIFPVSLAATQELPRPPDSPTMFKHAKTDDMAHSAVPSYFRECKSYAGYWGNSDGVIDKMDVDETPAYFAAKTLKCSG